MQGVKFPFGGLPLQWNQLVLDSTVLYCTAFREYSSQLMQAATSVQPFHCKDIKKAKMENRKLRVGRGPNPGCTEDNGIRLDVCFPPIVTIKAFFNY